MKTTGYKVIDKRTGEAIGKPLKSHKSARNKKDRLDTAYGAIRYSIVEVFDNGQELLSF